MTQSENVKITITTEDKSSQPVKAAGDNFKKFKATLGETVQSLTGFSLAQIGVAGAVGMTLKTISSAINDYSAYVEQIDKMTMATGMTAVEMSRLSQVADDFRVDINGLQGALGMALKNGFNPTTENLAKLSDELKGMADPTAKAEYLTKIFGRQWEVVIPLLDRGGDAIRAAADGIDDSLVVTDQSIQANREYQAAVDNLNDSWTGFKNTLARDVIPALTATLNYINENTARIADLEHGIDGLAGGYSYVVKAQQDAVDTSGDWNDAAREELRAAKKLEEAHEDLAPAIDQSASTTWDAKQAAAEAARSYDEFWRKVIQTKEATEDLELAQADLASAQASFAQGAGRDFASTLESQFESLPAWRQPANELEEGLRIIDEVMGTNTLSQYEMAAAQEELARQFAAGEISAEEFKESLEGWKDTWEAFDEDVRNATEKVDLLQQMLDTLDGTYYINIEFQHGSFDPGEWNPLDPLDPRASGGPVDAHSPYLVGERGPELFIPYSSGQVIDSASTNNILNGGSSSSGNTYNLTIRTTQSPRVVQRGFALERALAGV